MRTYLSDKIAIYIDAALLASMIVALIIELLIHLYELIAQKNSKREHLNMSIQYNSYKKDETFSLYKHGENDTLFNMPNVDID